MLGINVPESHTKIDKARVAKAGRRIDLLRIRTDEEEPVLVPGQIGLEVEGASGHSDSLVDLEAPMEFLVIRTLEGTIDTSLSRTTTHQPDFGLDNFELRLLESTADSNSLSVRLTVPHGHDGGGEGGGEGLIPEVSKDVGEGAGRSGLIEMGKAELDVARVLLPKPRPKGWPNDDALDLDGGDGDFVSPDMA